MALNGFVGQSVPQLSQALGNGIVNSILATNVYTGMSTGLGLGVGASTGILSGGIVIGPVVSNLIFTQLTMSGFLGTKTLLMSNAIGVAVSTHMLTAIVQGVSTAVAVGTGTGVITGVLGPVVGSTIFLQMTALGMLGTKSQQLSFAIGNAIALAFSTTIVNTTIVGVPVGPVPPLFPPIPIVGSDAGKLF
jgi:hypothetical protein